MKIKIKKKAIIFTMSALFITILMFSFVSYYLSSGTFDAKTEYNQILFNHVNDEVTYFQNIYLKNVFEYSAFNTLILLDNSTSNKTFYESFEKNYTKLNQLFYEGIYNGSFYNNKQNYLTNKTLKFFLDLFKEEFSKEYKGDFTYKILGINVYENTPYYVSFDLLGNFTFKINQENTSWSFTKLVSISLPVYNLVNPLYKTTLNKNITIRPFQLYSTYVAWNNVTFNESLEGEYSLIFNDESYNYLIGSSFLEKLLNITLPSYKNVLDFWTFDKILNYGEILDNNLGKNNGILYGSTYLILDFNDNKVKDISSYNHTIISFNNNFGFGIYNSSANFNGFQNITLSNKDFNLNFTKDLTLKMWFYLNSYYNLGNSKTTTLFQYGSDDDLIKINISKYGKIYFVLGSQNGGTKTTFSTNINVSKKSWHFLAITFDGNSGICKIYIDNKIVNIGPLLNYENTTPIKNFLNSSNNIILGENLNGSLDEVEVISRVLSSSEINDLYSSQSSDFVDVKDSPLGKTLYFDGNKKNNVTINVNPINVFNLDSYSLMFWFLPLKVKQNQNLGLIKFIGDTENLSIYLWNNSEIFFNLSNGNSINSSFDINSYNFVVLNYNKTSNNVDLYLNKKLINNKSEDFSISNIKKIIFSWNFQNSNYSYYGFLDDVKLFNTTIDKNRITYDFYNFNEFEKGDANFFTLINSNLLGLNSSKYSGNVSSSSFVFFNHYFNNKNYNMTLYNLSNYTSSITSKRYYNLLVDNCLIRAFNLPFNGTELNFVHQGEYHDSCDDFIKEGIY